MMWVDKYKPCRVEDMILCDDVKKQIDKFMVTRNVPNLIVTGNTGTGKSSLVDCIARDIFGELYKERVFRVASIIEKNIKQMQETMETFCKRKFGDDAQKMTSMRMFIVDDVDGVQDKIQNLMAALMEKYSDVCYLYTCDSISNVQESIQSRCSIIYMQCQSNKILATYLEKICSSEGHTYSHKVITRLVSTSHGDIRKCINSLQLMCDNFIDMAMETFDNICDLPNVVSLERMIKNCIDNDAYNAIAIGLELYDDGYNCSDILGGLFDILMSPECQIYEDIKVKFLEKIGKAMYHVIKSVDDVLQLECCIIELCDGM